MPYMRTETPQPIRLSDYRPPAFLVDEVHLTFQLEPNVTRVTARLNVRRNGEHAEPLRFNGERLKPVSVAIDGRVLAEGERTIDELFLTIPDTPDAFTLETVVEIDPEANKALEGLYMSGGRPTCCRATRSVSRPMRGIIGCWRTAISWSPAPCPADDTLQSGTTPSPSPATCSRWWPASSMSSKITSSP
jgi:hypothetical protein